MNKKNLAVLPFDGKADEFVETVFANNITVLRGDTGSGKTLRSGPALLAVNPELRIACTQPRRNAVRSIAKRMAFEQGWELGGPEVGYYLAREKSPMSRGTKIRIQVDQSLLNRILENPDLPDYDVAILDEQHLRTIPIDVLQGCLSRIFAKRPEFKIIISSATPNLDGLTKYFGQFGQVGVVEVCGRPGKVEVRWGYMLKREHHIQAIIRWINVLIEEGAGGKWLVFLPGYEEIRQVMNHIESLRNSRIDALACYGEQDADEQDRIYDSVPKGGLRFIPGTEIMETSITIPDAIGVIDGMEVRRRIIDWQGIGKWTKVHIAKDAAKQRMGRIGRLSGSIGKYLPIIGFENSSSSEAEWSRLPEHGLPEILRIDPEQAILTVEAMDIPFGDFPWMDKPEGRGIEVSTRNLQRLGALDEAGRITEGGRIYARLPLSARLSKALFKAKELGCLPQAKILAAALEERELPFYVPGRRKDFELSRGIENLLPEEARNYVRTKKKETRQGEVDVRYLSADSEWNGQRLAKHFRKQFAGGLESDLAAIINAYQGWLDNGRSAEWARNRMMKPKALWGIFNNIRDINDALKEVDINNNGERMGAVDCEKISRALAAGMVNDIAVRGENGYSGMLYTVNISDSSIAPKNEEVILFSNASLIEGRRGREIRLAEIAAPVSVPFLEADNRQLCSYEPGLGPYYDPKKDIVMSSTRVCFSGLKVAMRTLPDASHAKAGEIFLNWLAERMVD